MILTEKFYDLLYRAQKSRSILYIIRKATETIEKVSNVVLNFWVKQIIFYTYAKKALQTKTIFDRKLVYRTEIN